VKLETEASPGGYCIRQGDRGGSLDNGSGSRVGEEEANFKNILDEKQIKHGDGWEVGVRE